MSKADRNGNRKKRASFRTRKPDLGYYYIVTDTEATEENYFNGLRDSLPKEISGRIVIKVSKTNTEQLVATCKKWAETQPQYGEPWIVFDRDKVLEFDKIIEQAKNNGIKVGWSNPCIEIWFSAYFGNMPTTDDSVVCCRNFETQFKRIVGREYKKNDQNIYSHLSKYGDVSTAIKTAKKRESHYLRNRTTNPSMMISCTTLHVLVKEILDKSNL